MRHNKPLTRILWWVLLGSLVILTACDQATPSPGDLEVKQQSVLSPQTLVETIKLNNCGGKAEAEQVASKSQEVQVELSGELGVDKLLIKAMVAAKYAERSTDIRSLRLVAPPNTHMEYKVSWITQSWAGVVLDKKRNKQLTYSAQTVRVELTSTRDLGCATATATFPPTATRRPTATATYGPAPTRTRTPLVSATASQRAVFTGIWLDHNVTQDSKVGLRIHVNFTTYGLKGKALRLAAYFYKTTGAALVDTNKLYNTTDGGVAVGVDFTPSYDSTNYSDYQLFIPYSELHLPDTPKTDCKVIVKVYAKDPTVFHGDSPYAYFTYGK